MEEQLITFETAKLAKEKGFHELVKYYICETSQYKIKEKNDFGLQDNNLEENYFSTPTQTLLQKWLRDNYKIEVLIKLSLPLVPNEPIRYTFYIYTTLDWYSQNSYETYEEALEAGLIQALKLIK